jgi:hypothetical protein
MGKRIYYTGGLNPFFTKEDEKNKLGVAGTPRPVKLLVGGEAVLLPAAGEYIDFPDDKDWLARDLMERYKHPDHIFFTDKPRLAKQIVENKVRIVGGTLIEKEVKQLTDDEILAAAERIRLERAALDNAVVLDESLEEIEEVKEEKPKATRGKKKTEVEDMASLEEELARIGGE